MAITVPSRFAVLSIDDDDFKPTKIKKSSTCNNKAGEKKKVTEKPKQQPSKKDEKKKQNKKQKKKNGNNHEEQQWEQWKQKDSMAVEETYEQQLNHAILLSKLSYEGEMENNAKLQKEQDQTKKLSNKKSKKSTMSLEEFNNMDTNVSQNQNSAKSNNNDVKLKESDTEFFGRLDKEISQEIRRGKEKETLKARLNQLDDNITSAQLKVELEKRDEIIKQLKEDNEALKKDISETKNRNKKLYSILAQGEMKDKAVVLAEVNRLQEIRDELTSTLETLRIELEQERSKTRASNVDSKSNKQSNKKRPASDNA